MEFANLPRRFSAQGRYTFDHWQNEKLIRVIVANTPENLLKINKIFSFHSNFMQNIIDFRENNFEINILTQPFLANNSTILPEQTAPQAKSIFKTYNQAFPQIVSDIPFFGRDMLCHLNIKTVISRPGTHVFYIGLSRKKKCKVFEG